MNIEHERDERQVVFNAVVPEFDHSCVLRWPLVERLIFKSISKEEHRAAPDRRFL